MRLVRRIVGGLALLFLAVAVLAFGVVSFVQTETGRAWLLDMVAGVSARSGMPVTIGRIEGILPTDMTLFDVAVEDEQGKWLRIDRLHVEWDLLALLDRRLSIGVVEVGRIALDRLPASQQASEDEPEPFAWPELPFDVDFGRLAIDRLEIGSAIAGEAFAFGIEAAARMGDPARGVELDLKVEQQDGGAAEATARITFVPETAALSVDVALSEPRGGLIARLAELPGAPAIGVRISGQGTLEDWTGDVSAAAGDADIDGRVRIRRAGDEAALEATVTARLGPVLPSEYSALFAGEARLDARVRIPYGAGSIAIERFELALAAGSMSLTGSIDPAAMKADATVFLEAPSSEPFAPLIGPEFGWDGARISVGLSGPIDHPRIDATASFANLSGFDRSAETVEVSVIAKPEVPLADRETVIPVTVRVDVQGLELAAGAAGDAVGRDVIVDFVGTVMQSGLIEASPLTVSLDGGGASFTGSIDPASVAGRLEASLEDLSRLAPLIGRPVDGRLALGADLDLDFVQGGIPVGDIGFDLSIEGLVLAEPTADGLIAGRLIGGGRIARDVDGLLTVDGLSLAGDAVELQASGTIGEADAELDVVVTLPDLARLEPRVEGSAEARVSLAGSPASPDLEGTLSVPTAVVEGRRIEGLSLVFAVTDPLGVAAADFDLSARVDDLPVLAKGRVGMDPAGGGRLSLSKFDAAGLTAAAELSIDGLGLVAGDARLKAADLSTLSNLAGMPLAGSAEAEVSLSREGGVQSAVAQVVLIAVESSGARIDKADLTLSGTIDAIAISGRVEAYEAAAEIDAVVRPTGDPILVELARLDLATRGKTARLTRPAGVSIGSDGMVEFGESSFAVDGGTVTLRGTVADALDLAVDLRALPLSLLDAIAPGTGLGGTLSGRAAITGPPTEPVIAFDLSATGVTHAAQVSSGLPSVEATARGRAAGGLVDLAVTAKSGRFASIQADGRVDFDGALALTVRGNVDIAAANELLSTGADRVGGRADLDLSVAGSASEPRLAGTAIVAGAFWTNEEHGVALSDIGMRLGFDGRSVTIAQLAASTPNGGTITGSGTVAVDPAAGFPAELSLRASDAELVSSELVQVRADADLALTGPLATAPRLGGTIDIQRMEIRVPDRLPPAVTLIDVEHRNLPPELRAQVPPSDPRRARGGDGDRPLATTGYAVALDLTVRAIRGLFVRGMGIDAELGGDLRIAGTSLAPDVVGGFSMRRGSLSVIGQRLEFTRGVVTLDDGSLDPVLDLVAEARAGSVLARILVEGRASAPRFRLESEPPLPEDEVLAQLLFAKSSSELSPIEALQVANAAAELGGVGVLGGAASGFGVLDRLRQGLGIDRLDVTPGLSGSGSSVTAGKYLGEGVYVGVERGAASADTKAKVEVDVTDWLKLEAEVGATSGEAVGVRMQWDY